MVSIDHTARLQSFHSTRSIEAIAWKISFTPTTVRHGLALLRPVPDEKMPYRFGPKNAMIEAVRVLCPDTNSVFPLWK